MATHSKNVGILRPKEPPKGFNFTKWIIVGVIIIAACTIGLAILRPDKMPQSLVQSISRVYPPYLQLYDQARLKYATKGSGTMATDIGCQAFLSDAMDFLKTNRMLDFGVRLRLTECFLIYRDGPNALKQVEISLQGLFNKPDRDPNRVRGELFRYAIYRLNGHVKEWESQSRKGCITWTLGPACLGKLMLFEYRGMNASLEEGIAKLMPAIGKGLPLEQGILLSLSARRYMNQSRYAEAVKEFQSSLSRLNAQGDYWNIATIEASALNLALAGRYNDILKLSARAKELIRLDPEWVQQKINLFVGAVDPTISNRKSKLGQFYSFARSNSIYSTDFDIIRLAASAVSTTETGASFLNLLTSARSLELRNKAPSEVIKIYDEWNIRVLRLIRKNAELQKALNEYARLYGQDEFWSVQSFGKAWDEQKSDRTAAAKLAQSARNFDGLFALAIENQQRSQSGSVLRIIKQLENLAHTQFESEWLGFMKWGASKTGASDAQVLYKAHPESLTIAQTYAKILERQGDRKGASKIRGIIEQKGLSYSRWVDRFERSLPMGPFALTSKPLL